MLRLLVRPGETIVINPPVYPPFPTWVAEVGARLLEVPLDAGNGWQIDLAALQRAFATGPAAYLLCNPHNPVGRVHRPDELAAIVELAARYGVPIVSDEIHAPLTLPGSTFTPLLTVPGAAEIAVALHSASKAWNLAGLKCAAIVAGAPAMQSIVDRLSPDVRWRVGHFGVLATVAAYTEAVDWLDRLLIELDSHRTLIGSLLRDLLPSVRWQPPEATFLAWLDCRAMGPDDSVQERFLQEGHVALEPGSTFGSVGTGYVRLNFGTSREILEEAFARMALVRSGG
jgi:cystathionine beta-lyase